MHGTVAHDDQTGQSFSQMIYKNQIKVLCLNADEENVTYAYISGHQLLQF